MNPFNLQCSVEDSLCLDITYTCHHKKHRIYSSDEGKCIASTGWGFFSFFSALLIFLLLTQPWCVHPVPVLQLLLITSRFLAFDTGVAAWPLNPQHRPGAQVEEYQSWTCSWFWSFGLALWTAFADECHGGLALHKMAPWEPRKFLKKQRRKQRSHL